MARRVNPADPEVRINVVLPMSERDAFDRACRYNGVLKQSMNWRIRELLRADAAGQLDVPRTKQPRPNNLPNKKAEPPKPARRRK